MRTTKVLLAAIFFSLTLIMKAQTIESKIASHMIEVKKNTQDTLLDLNFLKEKVKDKSIVFLGEAGHGDGKTFDVKCQIIKYLVENEHYTTVVLEGLDFFLSQIVCGKQGYDTVITHDAQLAKADKGIRLNDFRMAWIPQWSYSKQTAMLVNMVKQAKVKCYGMESHTGFYYYNAYLSRLLEEYSDSTKLNVLTKSEWATLIRFDNQIEDYNPFAPKFKDDSIELYKKLLGKVLSEIEKSKPELNSKGDMLIQSMKNVFGNIKEFKAYADTTMEGDIAINNIRDSEMYANLAWYMQRHPLEKIIIWAASFHGCEDLGNIKHRLNDSTYYKRTHVMGEYLRKNFNKKVYSIACISSEGKEGLNYDTATYNIDSIPENSLEYQMAKTNYSYGFIDFESLRNDKELYNKKFHSMILGYKNKEGRWLSAFEGVFYIRKQERAIAQYKY
jgi:erythromycin esterase